MGGTSRLVFVFFFSTTPTNGRDIWKIGWNREKIYFERKKKQDGAFPVSFISREEEFPVLICRESAIRIQSAHFSPFRDSSVTSLKIDVKSWPQNRESIELEI